MRKRGLFGPAVVSIGLLILALVLIFFTYKILGQKGVSILDFFRNLLRFGG